MRTETTPILATGFKSSATQIPDFFEWGEDGVPNLTEKDESTKQKNLFLVGPSVQHKNVIFCFIYKYRQRFAVVAKEVIERLNLDYDEEVFEKYKRNQMCLEFRKRVSSRI